MYKDEFFSTKNFASFWRMMANIHNNVLVLSSVAFFIWPSSVTTKDNEENHLLLS